MEANAYTCAGCNSSYSIKDGIPVFTDKEEYWCNADRPTMARLIAEAESSGDWHGAVKKHIPAYDQHISPYYRADAQFILPVDGKSRVLDAGAMWGGITIPLAQYCQDVYAIDKTWETLRFLGVRAHQLGLNNITLAVSSVHSLPFPDDFFDCVILNGVLEWLGSEEEIILERQGAAKRDDAKTYTRRPDEMQLAGLRELFRVIKPGGSIYVAIENRIGLQYYFGYPDDHVNIRFASVLPRKIANFITRKLRNTDYRTYTYSPRALAGLIEKAGFATNELYSVYPHTNTIARLTPFTIFDRLGRLPTQGDVPFNILGRIKVFLFSKVWSLVPNPWRKTFSPSLSLIAQKANGEPRKDPRIISALKEAGVLPNGGSTRYAAVIVNNRYANDNPVNHIIYDASSGTPLYFCKVARERSSLAIMEEADQLKSVRERLGRSSLTSSIQQISYAGRVDGVSLLVMPFIDGHRIGNGMSDFLRRIDIVTKSRGTTIQYIGRKIQTHARRRWLRSVDGTFLDAVTWLAQFQKATATGSMNFGADGVDWVRDQLERIVGPNVDTANHKNAIAGLNKQLAALGPVTLPICMQHGDFDFYNLIRTPSGLVVLDFEHVADQALPLFDLANLVFQPLLQEWRNNQQGISLRDYAATTGWSGYLTAWLRRYSREADVPMALLSLLPALGVIEQNAKRYPKHRNPYDFSMYGERPFAEMIDWTLDL